MNITELRRGGRYIIANGRPGLPKGAVCEVYDELPDLLIVTYGTVTDTFIRANVTGIEFRLDMAHELLKAAVYAAKAKAARERVKA